MSGVVADVYEAFALGGWMLLCVALVCCRFICMSGLECLDVVWAVQFRHALFTGLRFIGDDCWGSIMHMT